MEREQGVVKWFSAPKGFGFIGRKNAPDVFVHHSSIIDMDGYRQLSEGQKVEFSVLKVEKGVQAHEVRVIE